MKSILVTGACGGMGSAAVKRLSSQGYRVFAMDIKACPPEQNVIPVEADITSEQSVNEAFLAVSGLTESLCAVVHFAGIYNLDSLAEMSLDAFDKIFSVNMRGVFLVNKTFLPLIKKDGRILITTSELAPLDPLPFTGIYAVTKSALDKYAYSLAMELQLLGIKVSVLRAGAVKTDMLGASTNALEKFCDKTMLYCCNAARFRSIVNKVEARNIPPEKIARKVARILKKSRPKFAYSINRNPLLMLLNVLPKSVQLFIIRMILK